MIMKLNHSSPLNCMLCRTSPCYEELPLCTACLGDFQEILSRKCVNCGKTPTLCTCPDGNDVRFLFYYEGARAKSLVCRLKTSIDAEAMDFLAELLVGGCGVNTAQFDGVAFVPRLRKSVRRYGYDQARELARSISRIYGIPLVSALKRVGGKEQKLLSRSERMKNIKGKYKLKEEFPREEMLKRILLVDDVYTTGATMKACADILRGSVARAVVPLALTKTNFLRK